jgi:hypothetical protein
MAVRSFTNLTTCSALADALASASHARLPRLLQGTWSGHTRLTLALRTLFTVAGGPCSSRIQGWKSLTRVCGARRPGCGRASKRRSALVSLGCGSSGWMGRSASLRRFGSDGKRARRSTIWRWSGSAMHATAARVTPRWCASTRGLPPKKSSSGSAIMAGTLGAS